MAPNFAEGEPARYAAAMLRVVLTLKREPDVAVESVIDRVARDTGVEATAFRRFLASHMDVVNRVARRS